MLAAVAPLHAYAQEAKKRLLTTFSHVPDDKLEWSPAPSGKSALRIAAHSGRSMGYFVAMLNGQRPPEVPADQLADMMEKEETSIKTREQAVSLIESATAEALAAMEALTQEQYDSMVPTPFQPMPMSFIVTLPGRHAESHAAQIDYLQTLWGDMDFYF